jgi:hypothetical protein
MKPWQFRPSAIAQGGIEIRPISAIVYNGLEHPPAGVVQPRDSVDAAQRSASRMVMVPLYVNA